MANCRVDNLKKYKIQIRQDRYCKKVILMCLKRNSIVMFNQFLLREVKIKVLDCFSIGHFFNP